MARFKCINEPCSSEGIEIIVEKVRWVWSRELHKLVATPKIICEECGHELEFIPNTEIPNLCINTFDSMSPDQKRAVIRKRSSDHMRKTGEDKDINERRRQIIADNKRMVTGGK